MSTEKDEKLRKYEETKRRFQERNKPEKDINEEMIKLRLLNRLSTLYIVTKPHDLWNNNPFKSETEKYGISDIDLFKHIPDYYVWLSKQMNPINKELVDEDEDESLKKEPGYKKITMKAVTSTIYKKWRQYTLQERREKGIPGSRREISQYIERVKKDYSEYFRADEKDKKEEDKTNKSTK